MRKPGLTMRTMPSTSVSVGKDAPTRMTSYRAETVDSDHVKLELRAGPAGPTIIVAMKRHEIERLYETLAVVWGD